jgi:hypothetical protein
MFDGVRSCSFQARGFTSHFQQSLSNVGSFSEQDAFLALSNLYQIISGN